jgi:hypothetical protein
MENDVKIVDKLGRMWMEAVVIYISNFLRTKQNHENTYVANLPAGN